MSKNNTRQNITYLGILLPLIIIASKIIRWTILVLSLVYMSIGWGMTERINKGDVWGGTGAGVLRNAEWLFNKINILGINTFVGWEIFFTILYNILFVIFIINFYKKNPYIGLKENIFIYFNLAILNIYCFAMSKESYQVLFWFLLAWCITSQSEYRKKVIALMIGLVFTFVFSRKYYALIGIYFVVIQFYVTSFLSNIDTSTSRGRKKLIQYILGLFAILAVFHFAFMGFMASASQDQYEELVRVNTREGSYAESEITPIFRGNRLMLTLDYFVKIFRLAFPIELLIKAKPTYLLTIVYQSLLAVFLYNAFKNRKKPSIEDLEEQEEDDSFDDEEIIKESFDNEDSDMENIFSTKHTLTDNIKTSLNFCLENIDEESKEEIEDEDLDEDLDGDENEKNKSIPETRDRIDTRTIALYTYLAFLLCSAMFEPDFGSWLRHQCVALPVIIFIL